VLPKLFLKKEKKRNSVNQDFCQSAVSGSTPLTIPKMEVAQPMPGACCSHVFKSYAQQNLILTKKSKMKKIP
jgi:hypothetical protein